MERHRLGHQRALRRLAADCRGQATVEYAVLLAAFLAVLVGLGLLMQAFQEGLFVEHAAASASHHIWATAGWWADVFGY